ncbi:MAG: glycosyltransferase [Phycisphaerales bacterium]|nr:glycosyltransferase [Phycisphaerales bacterium]
MLVIRSARNTRVKLSVVIPCYNEEKNLDVLHTRLTEVVSRCTDDYELICVNDGSRDRTLEGLRTLAAKDPHVKFLSFSRNFGHETAVAAGLDRAGASWEGEGGGVRCRGADRCRLAGPARTHRPDGRPVEAGRAGDLCQAAQTPRRPGLQEDRDLLLLSPDGQDQRDRHPAGYR